MGKVSAIILSAGSGKRMNTKKPKQYLLMNDKPLLSYTIKAFEESNVDEIIIVTGKGDTAFVEKEIVAANGFSKVSGIVEGGKERYDSVYEGLKTLNGSDYVLVHDGARPCIRKSAINAMIESVKTLKACVMGVPVKDTIKVVREDHTVCDTPKRSLLWSVQTPQAFQFDLLKNAYDQIITKDCCHITDDSMIVETVTDVAVHMIMGDYTNIKVTTQEDLIVVKEFLEKEFLNVE